MTAIYSTALIGIEGLGGTASYGPVADGQVLVVRSADVYSSGAVVPPFTYVFLQGSEGQAFFYYEWTEVSQAWAPWRGRHVINAGGFLHVAVANGNVDVSVMGYLLSA